MHLLSTFHEVVSFVSLLLVAINQLIATSTFTGELSQRSRKYLIVKEVFYFYKERKRRRKEKECVYRIYRY
jgi:hypothetical protein